MKARLLVIDDATEESKVMATYLNNSGYELISVGTITSASKVLDTQSIDLILCNLAISNQGAIKLLKRAKTEFSIPFIVISEVSLASDVVTALHLGADDYLVKPIIDLIILEHSIKRNLDNTRLEKENKIYRSHLERTNKELTVRLEELNEDQQAGRQIQLKMLPQPLITPQLNIKHTIKPSLILSGDFLDYFPLNKQYYGFYLADVAGHGASSAFVTVLLKNLTYRLKRNLNRGSSHDLFHPVKVLERINKELLDTGCSKHLTIVYCVLNLETMKLNYSIGGHLPMPILYSQGKASYLEGKGMPVGLFQSAQYNAYEMTLPSEFTLSIFSDGVLELLPQTSLALKEEYLLRLIEQTSANHEAIITKLSLNTDENFPDDVALVSVSGV